MKTTSIKLIIITFTLSACSAGYIPRPMDGWWRVGSENLDITTVKKECGYFEYHDEYHWQNPARQSLKAQNRYAEIIQCMKNHGFISKYYKYKV